jgi:putative hydrolase of HD superfamily
MKELYEEMRERKTLEAKIYKSLDSLEALISHNESDLSTWEDHEYDLQMVYADDRVTFSRFMTELREVIREETREKIRTEGGRR